MSRIKMHLVFMSGRKSYKVEISPPFHANGRFKRFHFEHQLPAFIPVFKADELMFIEPLFRLDTGPHSQESPGQDNTKTSLPCPSQTPSQRDLSVTGPHHFQP